MSTLSHVGLAVGAGAGDANGGGGGGGVIVGMAGGGGGAAAPCGARVLTRRPVARAASPDGSAPPALPSDPCTWGTVQVVRWWLEATAAAAAAINAAATPDGGTPTAEAFTLRRSQWPSGAKLGIGFEPAAAPADDAPPVVSKLSTGTPLASAAAACRHAVAPGWRLVGCVLDTEGEGCGGGGGGGGGRAALLATLKKGAAALAGPGDADATLTLRFEPPSPCAAAPPRVPRMFAATSRLGVGKGSDLLSAFADPDRGLRKWAEVCAGDKALARALFDTLRGLAAPHGGTPEERLERDRHERAEAAAAAAAAGAAVEVTG